jgi:large conductance mechanosensitive channel
MTFLQEFAKFLKTFGIIGLALALVIGQASSNLVSSLVEDIINPFVGLFLPSGSLDDMTVKITNPFGAISEFKVGHLISGMINFIIMAFIIFLAYKGLSKVHLVEDKTNK